MACKGCAKNDIPVEPEVENVSPQRLAINCRGCGLMRLIPSGLQVGEVFELVICPKCGVGFKGKFVDGGVEGINA